MIEIFYCPYCMEAGWLDENMRDIHLWKKHKDKPADVSSGYGLVEWRQNFLSIFG